MDASSEDGMMAVNGMSYSQRDSENANSAIIMAVNKDEYREFLGKDADNPLDGIIFQEILEKNAYKASGGQGIPYMRLGDFKRIISKKMLSDGDPGTYKETALYDDAVSDINSDKDHAFVKNMTVTPSFKGQSVEADITNVLPDALNNAFIDGMREFDRKLPGFYNGEVIVAAVESRTSSPVRIKREADCESSIKGIYPCGEGAGYAGGIVSAAMDGVKVAECMIKYHFGGMKD